MRSSGALAVWPASYSFDVSCFDDVTDVEPIVEMRQAVVPLIHSSATNQVIPMRAADPSLKKKFRTERMSRLERDYRW